MDMPQMEGVDPFEPSTTKKALDPFSGKVTIHLFFGLELFFPGKSRQGLFLIMTWHVIPLSHYFLREASFLIIAKRYNSFFSVVLRGVCASALYFEIRDNPRNQWIFFELLQFI